MNETTKGHRLRCGHCDRTHRGASGRDAVLEVLNCWGTELEQAEQARAELAAERGYERWLEDGGAASERIWAENERDRVMGVWG